MKSAFLLCLLAIAAPGSAQTAKSTAARVQVLSPAEARPPAPGPGDRFSGAVQVTPLFDARPPARTSAGSVTFSPGARSAWHAHPLGQTLIVISGSGFTQAEGGEVTRLAAGDVLWCPPNVRHWHGASPTASLTHIAVQETLDGRNVVWMEKVSDAEYRSAVAKVPAP